MMNEMLAKGKSEKEAEIKMFDEYEEWVEDESRKIGFEIKTLKTSIEELTAEAEKADADVADLSAKIEELEGEIAAWESDQKAAKELRDSEHAEYTKISTDYGESVDALARAIEVLSSKQGATPQAAEMLLQTMARHTRGMRRVLAAFLEEKASQARSQASDESSGGPAVAAYESQSGKIVGMLEKLQKKFKQELDAVEEDESNKAHAFELEMLHLTDSINAATEDLNQKSDTKAQRAMDSAEAKKQLADAKADLAESEKYLSEITQTFRQKKQAFEGNQKTRAEEIAAIAKAIEIISGSAVKGAAEKHLPTLVQSAKAVSLLQTSSSSRRNAARQKASEFLRKQAETLGSKVLSLAAVRLSFDPFAKVIKMIKELITRLEEEAAAEAGHKAWCDEELKNNKLKKDQKTSEVDELTAAKEKLEGEIAALAKDLEDLAAAQAALAKAMKEATEIREKEKAENLVTIKDAKEAQEAVNQALVVLREFYDKQSFLQQVPEMKEYKGQGGAAGGVVGMLEVILSDFARLEAETTADEKQAANEYDTFMADSKADSEAKHKEEFDKGLLKDQKEHDLKGTKKDLAATQEELDAALKYYEELKPQCLEVHVSYEERVAKRKEEIESLKKAYEVLSQQ
jgi:DNA repair exonuclease SbcCD ATPase subunit